MTLTTGFLSLGPMATGWYSHLRQERDGHPENKDVMLRLMSLHDNKITVLAKLLGGQGTINVVWSPTATIGVRELSVKA